MARLKITSLNVGDVVKQRRTGDLFTVTEIRGNIGVTLQGSESSKQITKTILERWYVFDEQGVQEPEPEQLSQEPNEEQCNETAATATEVQSTDESKQDESLPDEVQEETVDEQPEEVGSSDIQGYDGQDCVSSEEDVSDSEEVVQSVCETVQRVLDSSVPESSGEQMPVCPVQPPIPKRGRGTGKGNKREPDPVIQKIYRQLKEYVMSLSDSVELRERRQYTAFHDGQNFAEVYVKKQSISMQLKADSIPAEYVSMCQMVPKTYGWTLRARYTILDESDVDLSKELLRCSWHYIQTHE